LLLSAAADTSVGLRYDANYDVCRVDESVPLLVVADGMGAGRGSTLAGRTAVDVFVEFVRGARVVDAATLRAAVAQVQRQVCAAGERLDELTGCTLTALVGCGPAEAWVVQVGDSRAYRLRDGLLELLTVDHTMAWLGAVYGWYPADSPAAERARYQLTRYIGHPSQPEPDLLNVALRPGDVFCLCTDGVADPVPYQRLGALLAGGEPAGLTASAIVAEALAAGGRDNATAAVLRVDPDPAAG
jgi:PPM family protein phosphatase